MVESLSSEHSALLVMDVQRATVERYSKDTPLLDHISTAIAAARPVHIPIIFIVVRFREGYPEISPRNLTFAAIRERGTSFSETNTLMEIHPAVAPQPEDIVVTKKRVSAFIGSDLDVVLRSQGIERLILTGIATSGVVLSTLRYAADMDYRLTVLSDCCADNDEEVHRVLMTKVFPRQATVLTVAEWSATLSK